MRSILTQLKRKRKVNIYTCNVVLDNKSSADVAFFHLFKAQIPINA